MSGAGTIEKIQALADGAFHSLCDAVLSVIEPRYRLLTPFGRNIRGQSVRGHPDSYVGASPELCNIAFEYSTQKRDWKAKALQDIKDAKASCPHAIEFVFATPMDIDRDGTGTDIAFWISQARAIVGSAEISIFGGRLIAQFLDTHRQDLRYVHLGIPCSRLSAEAILIRCQEFSKKAVQRLIDQMRFVPTEYVPRTADTTLLELWHRCIDSDSLRSSFRMIPLIGDSGIGKTSLVARFAQSMTECWPALLLQARDLAFDHPDSLVRCVVETVEGVLSDDVRHSEEAALIRALCGNRHFTVILDGLDESIDPTAVQRAIQHWLSSELADCGTLVTTSRPEFWQRCANPSWRRYIVDPQSIERTEPRSPRGPNPNETDRLLGISIVAPFTDHELSQAWTKAGFDGHPFVHHDSLRDEMRHPFTFHTARELVRTGIPLSTLRTRTDLIRIWINERLKSESLKTSNRISPELFREVLLDLSNRAEHAPGGWLQVDKLAGVSRFNATSPPGPAVEGLLHANLLESRRPFGAEIRFTFDAVHDFFLAERDAAELNDSSIHAVVDGFAIGSFTDCEWRLERMGGQLAAHPLRNQFAEMLIGRDLWKAAALMRGQPDAFDRELLNKLIELLCGQLGGAVCCRRAKAAELLAWFPYPEVHDLMPAALLPADQYTDREIAILTKTILRLSIVACAHIVPKCWWFRRGQYFSDIRSLLENTRSAFRQSLCDLCLAQLDGFERDSHDHAALVNILGYCHDERILPHLERLLTETSALHWDETAALVELGTKRAASLFRRFVALLVATGRTTHEMLNVEPKDDRIWSALGIEMRARRKHLSLDFEESVLPFLGSTNAIERAVGQSFAERFPSPLVVRTMLSRLSEAPTGPFSSTRISGALGSLEFGEWKDLWDTFSSVTLRNVLLHAAEHVRDPRIEPFLLDGLEDSGLRDAAVHTLSKTGCLSAAPRIRDHLSALLQTDSSDWTGQISICNFVRALGNLHDPAAVPLLERAAQMIDAFAARDAIVALADLRTAESGNALLRLTNQSNNEHAVAALIHHGQSELVESAVAIAERQPNAPQWLIANGLEAIWFFRGWSRGRFHSHVDTGPVIEFLRDHIPELRLSDVDKLFNWFGYVDGEPVRQLLRQFADPNNSPVSAAADPNRTAERARMMLADRGDDSVAEAAAKQIMNGNWFGRRLVEDDLENFSPQVLVAELKFCLTDTTTSEQIERLIAQIGRLGSAADADSIRPWMASANQSVINIACEAVTRLTDPQLLPHSWP
jgi:hypothetical protein